MAKFSSVPSYCVAGTTPQDIAAARDFFALHKQNFAWYRQAQFRQAAMIAKMQNGMPLTALEHVEFGDIIGDYRAHLSDLQSTMNAEHQKMLNDKRIAWEKEEAARKAAEAAKHRDLMSITDPREAQASLPPAEYMRWCQLEHAQRAISKMMG
jgi:hypothetical protein